MLQSMITPRDGEGDTETWDVFVAHAAIDAAAAETLYELLVPHCRTFLDKRCLNVGDDWDRALLKAQQQSLLTVVLMSSHTPRAYYQREEIAAAIAMAREDPESHRVVPIYLDGRPGSEPGVYGLRLKHGIAVEEGVDLGHVAETLLDALTGLEHGREPPQRPRVRNLNVERHHSPFKSTYLARFDFVHQHTILYETARRFLTGTSRLLVDDRQIAEWSSHGLELSKTEGTYRLEGVDCRWKRRVVAGVAWWRVWVGADLVLKS